MFHVHILRSAKTRRRYVGSCEDLDDRLRRYNSGESKATRHGIPWTGCSLPYVVPVAAKAVVATLLVEA